MVWKIRSEWLKGKMCSSPLKINSPPHPTPILIFLKVYIYKDSDEIFNFSETSRTHLTLIVVLAEITDVFLQFNLGEKIIWGILCSTSPIVVYFCLLLPICLLIKCKIKYACVAKKKNSGLGRRFLLMCIKCWLQSQVFKNYLFSPFPFLMKEKNLPVILKVGISEWK